MQFSYVYIVTNKPRGVLYIGVTSDLVRRISEHRGSLIRASPNDAAARSSFGSRFEDITLAIQREKSLKRSLRDWKIALVEEANPTWRDPFSESIGPVRVRLPSLSDGARRSSVILGERSEG